MLSNWWTSFKKRRRRSRSRRRHASVTETGDSTGGSDLFVYAPVPKTQSLPANDAAVASVQKQPSRRGSLKYVPTPEPPTEDKDQQLDSWIDFLLAETNCLTKGVHFFRPFPFAFH